MFSTGPGAAVVGTVREGRPGPSYTSGESVNPARSLARLPGIVAGFLLATGRSQNFAKVTRMLESLFLRSSNFKNFVPARHDEVVLVLPYIDRDLAVQAEQVLRVRANHPGLLVLVEDDERLGYIRVANFVYSRTASPFFGYLAQDAYPGMYWLEQGMKALKGSQAGLLPFNEGRFFGTVAAFGLVRRAWAATLYRHMLFYPGYRTHYADTELTAIAYTRNQLIFNPHALLVEVDYGKHTKPNNPDDERLYKERLASGFGGLIPVGG